MSSLVSKDQGRVVGLHRYRPRNACRDLFTNRSSEVLLSGPAGTGKSRACLEKLMAMCLVNPGMRGLIVRKTMASLGSSALHTWRRHVATEAFEVGAVEYYGGSSQEPAQYRFTNGSAVMIGGMDKPSKIMSTEYDVIYVQEATELTVDDWEALTTRLRNGAVSFQQLIADCNPSHPSHWLKNRCDEGRTVMLYSVHEDNPTLFNDDGSLTEGGRNYIAKLDALTGVRKLRLRNGLWVAAEGVIYEEWQDATHLVDRFEIPEDWQRWWAVDFGYTHPFVLQCWAENPDGDLFMYREIFHTKRTVDVHARAILAEVTEDGKPDGKWLEPRPSGIICDHDAEGRAQLKAHTGLNTIPANKKVKEGIEAVQVRLRDRRLYILRDSLIKRDPDLAEAKRPTCTVEEIPGYVWNETKDAPVKEQDDGCDTLRYMVAHRDLRNRPNIRWM